MHFPHPAATPASAAACTTPGGIEAEASLAAQLSEMSRKRDAALEEVETQRAEAHSLRRRVAELERAREEDGRLIRELQRERRRLSDSLRAAVTSHP